MSTKSRRQTILGITNDLVGRFTYYDRKDSETLPRGAIQEAIKAGEITVDEIINEFATELRKVLK